MKTPFAVAAAVALVAFAGAPAPAEAGGLHRLCPTDWVKPMHDHHHGKKVAVAKKPAKKVVAKRPPSR
jgi:hypothetical protein